MHRAIDVYIVGSAWNALVAKSIADNRLNESVFLVEGGGENALTVAMSVFNNTDKYFRYGNIQDVMFRHVLNRRGFRGLLGIRRTLAVLLSDTKNRISGYKVDTIFIFNASSPLTRYFVANIYHKEVCKVEDGINDYLADELDPKTSLKNLFKMSVGALIGVAKYYSKSNCWMKIRRSYYFFPDKIKHKNGVTSLAYIKSDLLKQIANSMPSFQPVEPSTVLFLGQSLSEDGSLSMDQEIEFHIMFFSTILRDGNKVVFKPHPRSSETKLKRLKDWVSANANGEILILTENVPAESLILSGGFASIVGFWSLPLIYSVMLFRVSSYTLLYRLFEMYPEARRTRLFYIHSRLAEIFPAEYKGYS